MSICAPEYSSSALQMSQISKQAELSPALFPQIPRRNSATHLPWQNWGERGERQQVWGDPPEEQQQPQGPVPAALHKHSLLLPYSLLESCLVNYSTQWGQLKLEQQHLVGGCRLWAQQNQPLRWPSTKVVLNHSQQSQSQWVWTNPLAVFRVVLAKEGLQQRKKPSLLPPVRKRRDFANSIQSPCRWESIKHCASKTCCFSNTLCGSNSSSSSY